MMERRYEAYKDVVVRPFYREHFARLDRQIVLVDALAAFNAGPDAVKDLESALAAILGSFRTGRTHNRERAVPPAHRPHPVRRHQGRPSASHQPRPAGALPRAHHRARDRAREILRRDRRCRRARGGARDARGDGRARARQAARHHRHAARRRDARRRELRRRDRGRVVPRRPAGRSGRAVRPGFTGLTAARTRPTIASCASARR